MKVLSFHSPKPYALFHLGQDIINRDYAPPKSILGKRILIHTAKKFDSEAAKSLFASRNRDTTSLIRNMPYQQLVELYQAMKEYPRGCLVGSVEITGFFEETFKTYNNEWAHGPYCWTIRDAVEFAVPLLVQGQQSLWEIDLEDVIETQLRFPLSWV